jgi:hypothetical protein
LIKVSQVLRVFFFCFHSKMNINLKFLHISALKWSSIQNMLNICYQLSCSSLQPGEPAYYIKIVGFQMFILLGMHNFDLDRSGWLDQFWNQTTFLCCIYLARCGSRHPIAQLSNFELCVLALKRLMYCIYLVNLHNFLLLFLFS